MAGKWKTFLMVSGLIFIAAGIFAGLPSPWPLVLWRRAALAERAVRVGQLSKHALKLIYLSCPDY